MEVLMKANRNHAELIRDLISFSEKLYIEGYPVYLSRTPTAKGKLSRGGYIIAGKKGHSDVSGVVAGAAVFFEAKTGNDTQRPDQKKFQKTIEFAGGYYYIYRDLKTARDIIYKILKGEK